MREIGGSRGRRSLASTFDDRHATRSGAFSLPGGAGIPYEVSVDAEDPKEREPETPDDDKAPTEPAPEGETAAPKAAEGPKPSFARRFVGGLAYALVLLALTLGGLEVLVRNFIPQVLPTDAPDLYVPADGIGWRRKADTRVWVNTGERDVEVCTDARADRVSCDAAKPPCTQRVLVIGDSYTEALAIPYDKTAWYQLQQDTGACVDVAGVGGYSPAQYAVLARERLATAPHYDVVLVSFYIGNDMINSADKLPDARQQWKHPMKLFPDGLSEADLHNWFHPYDQWIESRSHLYVATRFAIRKLIDEGDVGQYGIPVAVTRSRMTDNVVNETTRALSMIADAARASGTKMVLTVVPFRNQVTDPDSKVLAAAFPSMAGDLDMHLPQEVLIPRWEKLEGVTVVDLLAPLAADARPELVGTYDPHLSPLGHELWFKALKGPVRAALGLP